MSAWPLNLGEGNSSFPLENWMRYQVQSLMNMQEPPSVEQTQAIMSNVDLTTRLPHPKPRLPRGGSWLARVGLRWNKTTAEVEDE
jgi:hypothetical protein